MKEQASGDLVETIDPQMRKDVSALLEKYDYAPLPKSAVTLRTKPDMVLAAYDNKGRNVATWDLSRLDDETMGEYGAGRWLKGAAKAFAKAVVGCVAGVVGYDEILSILEKRVSYWVFVKWLARKVGWGLAISCASGAAAAVLGW